ncbi:MAG: endonuclease/exonuclease/phosphatase family protein [Pseudonocardia sp.]
MISPSHSLPTTGPAPGRSAPPRVIRRWFAAALFTLLVAMVTIPDMLFGLDRHSPFTQLVAFRPLILAGTIAVLAVLGLLLIVERRVLPFAAGVLAVVITGSCVVLPRMIVDNPAPGPGRSLTVLAFNVFDGDTDVEQLARLIELEHPTLVSLPEAGDAYRSRLAPLVEPLGYTLHTSTGPGTADVAGVTALVRDDLDDVAVTIDESTPFASLVITGGGLGELRFVAYHAIAPVPGTVPQWRSDLARLGTWCTGPTPAIIAGDLNATLDHSVLRAVMVGCVDAAEQRGRGLLPTWGPTPRTQLLGPQIDHVLATEPISTETFDVRHLAGSDHRAVLTRLRLPG